MKSGRVIGDRMIEAEWEKEESRNIGKAYSVRKKVLFCVWRDEIHVSPLSRLHRLFGWNKRFRSGFYFKSFHSVCLSRLLVRPTVVCWSPTTNNGEEFTLSHQPTRLWLRGYFIRQRRRQTVTISQQDLLLLVVVVFSFSIPYYSWFIPLSECGIFSVCKNGRWIKLSIYRNRGITAWVLEFNFGPSVWMWTG